MTEEKVYLCKERFNFMFSNPTFGIERNWKIIVDFFQRRKGTDVNTTDLQNYVKKINKGEIVIKEIQE